MPTRIRLVFDDNKIGDSPYDIPGEGYAQDNAPIWDDGCDVDCEDDDGEPDATGFIVLTILLVSIGSVVGILGVLYSRNPEKFKEFPQKNWHKKSSWWRKK